jgi:hypothetical protein
MNHPEKYVTSVPVLPRLSEKHRPHAVLYLGYWPGVAVLSIRNDL